MTSGDGMLTLPNGEHRWGLYGAAGLLLRHVRPSGSEWFLLAYRSPHVHGGGCWGIPGGARDLDETAAHAAYREFVEEFGVAGSPYPPQVGEIIGEYVDDHGGWAYTTVIANSESRLPLVATSWEHTDAQWVTREDIADVALHPAFAAALPALYALIDGEPVGSSGLTASEERDETRAAAGWPDDLLHEHTWDG